MKKEPFFKYDELNGKPRFPKNLNDILQTKNLYYYPKYNLCDLGDILGADDEYLSNDVVRNHYINLSYELIAWTKTKKVIQNIVEGSNFLVTSIDRGGIKSPLCLHELKDNTRYIHPGNKRLIIARYLQLEYIPVVISSIEKVDNAIKLNTLDDIKKIYGNDISICTPNDTVEIHWHGDTFMRNDCGGNHWMKKSREENSSLGILKYLIENGLEVVSPFIEKDITKSVNKKRFVTKFRKSSSQLLYVEVYNKDYLMYDFWDLFYHMDPTVKVKSCKTEDIKLVNLMSNTDIELNECSLASSLTRKKINEVEYSTSNI